MPWEFHHITHKNTSGTPLKCQKRWGFRGLRPLTPTRGSTPWTPAGGTAPTPHKLKWNDAPDCYLEFKLSYLDNLKLFSIRVKRIIWTCSFVKKRRQVLALFISIFLRNRSLSDARWFCGKKHKIGKGNLYWTENQLSWNEMCCASNNHNYMCHTCAKEFLNSSFNTVNKAVIDKISNFQDIAPNFTFSQISWWAQIILLL